MLYPDCHDDGTMAFDVKKKDRLKMRKAVNAGPGPVKQSGNDSHIDATNRSRMSANTKRSNAPLAANPNDVSKASSKAKTGGKNKKKKASKGKKKNKKSKADE